MIDVHAHLTDSSFIDIEDVLGRAKVAGVERVITSITSPAELGRAFELLTSFPDMVSLTVGFDPSILSPYEYRMFHGLIDQRCFTMVGLGEVGLDHFRVRDHVERAVQESFFRTSILLARTIDMPLIVHSRSAGRRALEVLKEEAADNVLMHAYDGRASDALEAVKEEYYFSIPTSVVYSEQKQKLVKVLPLSSLMLETDSPVLGPERGARNEPANLIFAARKVAEIKRVPLEEVLRVTTENARRFFRI